MSKHQLKHDVHWPSIVSRPGEGAAQQAGDSPLQWQASLEYSPSAADYLPGWQGQMPGSQASRPRRSRELLLHTSLALAAPPCSSRLCYIAASEHGKPCDVPVLRSRSAQSPHSCPRWSCGATTSLYRCRWAYACLTAAELGWGCMQRQDRTALKLHLISRGVVRASPLGSGNLQHSHKAWQTLKDEDVPFAGHAQYCTAPTLPSVAVGLFGFSPIT